MAAFHELVVNAFLDRPHPAVVSHASQAQATICSKSKSMNKTTLENTTKEEQVQSVVPDRRAHLDPYAIAVRNYRTRYWIIKY